MGIKVGVIDASFVLLDTMKHALPMYLEECEIIIGGPKDLEKFPSDVDVFIVDYEIDIIGPDVIRKLRLTHPNARIIGWTMYLDSEMKKEFEEAGADMVISKDVTMKQLAELIESLL